ncbi:acyl carrier protein [Paenibacillus sp. Dod16]|uniref:acyl carrier protein n=1 Tax=Paenibacillus sp. Dod16 TaxID=3416392 RepID=UPI003CEEED9F
MNTDMEIKMKRVFENAGIEFPEDTQLDLEKSGVDSVLLLNLIVNIEKEYEIKIPDDELLYENFSSLSTIYEFVNRLLQKEE